MSRVHIRAEIQLRGGEWVRLRGVRTGEDIQIVRGRADEGAQVDPSKMTFQLDNRDGRYSPGNPRSPLYRRIGKNTPIRLSIEVGETTYWRFAGEIAVWPVLWDLSGNDRWVNIRSHGILRRLGQGGDRVPDAMRRHVMAYSPVAYWPLTDGETGRQGSPVVGHQPMRTYAMREDGSGGTPIMYTAGWSEGELEPWLDPVVALPEEEQRGRLSATVRPSPSATSWAVEIAQRGVGLSDSLSVTLQGDTTSYTWAVGWARDVGDQMYISLTTESDTDPPSVDMVEDDWSESSAFDGEVHLYRLEVEPDGSGGSSYRLFMDGSTIASGTWSVPARPVRAVRYEWWVPDDDVSEHAELGHVSVWDTTSSSYPSAQSSYEALRGHLGEPAADRVVRLCAEAAIPLEVVGDPADSLPMGPQYPDAVLDLLYACQAVDGGVLYESREVPGLAYRTLRSKYNRGASLEED